MDGTKAALACEWLEPSSVEDVLNALRYYTMPIEGDEMLSPHEADMRAWHDLVKKHPEYKQLYKAAQALPGFLKTLAEANTRKTKAMTPAQKGTLFEDANNLIKKIYDGGQGAGVIADINSAFAQKPGYTALYELLKAYPGGGPTYVKDLETLRAAFEIDSKYLGGLVAECATGAPAEQK